MISIGKIRKGMVFSLPSEMVRDSVSGEEVYVTGVITSDGRAHELRSVSRLFFTVLFVDSFDCGRVKIGVGETRKMDVRMDYIQKYGDIVMPSPECVKSPDGGVSSGGDVSPDLAAAQVLEERVFGSEGLALALHNAEDVATMRHVVLALHGYIVKGRPLPPLMVDSFHDCDINCLVASIYEHVAEARKGEEKGKE